MITDFLDKEPFPCFLEWDEWNDDLQQRFGPPETAENPGSICPAKVYYVARLLTKREVIELIIEFGPAEIEVLPVICFPPDFPRPSEAEIAASSDFCLAIRF